MSNKRDYEISKYQLSNGIFSFEGIVAKTWLNPG
jgi:hypothetical protein